MLFQPTDNCSGCEKESALDIEQIKESSPEGVKKGYDLVVGKNDGKIFLILIFKVNKVSRSEYHGN